MYFLDIFEIILQDLDLKSYECVTFRFNVFLSKLKSFIMSFKSFMSRK